MFCAINGYDLHVPTEEAVTTMLAIASGEMDEASASKWLKGRITTRKQ